MLRSKEATLIDSNDGDAAGAAATADEALRTSVADGSSGRPSPLDPGSLAFKLNRLIETAPEKLSTRGLARILTERGTPVSTSFIGYLRDGRRDNPTYRVIEGLADYFRVPCGYFFADRATAPLLSILDLYQALEDEDVRTVLVEMPKLRPATRRWLAQQMPALRRIEAGGDPLG